MFWAVVEEVEDENYVFLGVMKREEEESSLFLGLMKMEDKEEEKETSVFLKVMAKSQGR